MRNLRPSLALFAALALSGSLLTGSPGKATTVLPCNGPDRNASYDLKPGQIAAFRTAVRDYSRPPGRVYTVIESGPVLTQRVRSATFRWAVIATTVKGEAWADIAVLTQAGCAEPLPAGDAEAWRGFVAHLRAGGFVSTGYRPHGPG